jgi:thiamine kinase-like enzyme
LSELEIPIVAEEITAEWLTAALRKRGVLTTSQVSEIKVEVLGEGEGFVGDVARLHLRYDAEESEAPRTLIAKLPTRNKNNRTMGELLGAYEREIFVYDQLLADLPVRTPRVYYADMDEAPNSHRDAQGAAALERLPGFFLGPIMALATFITSLRKRRYVLLIEELEGGRVGDQIAGCSAEESERIVRGIARVHARHWGSPALASTWWLRQMDLNPRTLHHIYKRNNKTFRNGYVREAGPEMERLFVWIDQHAPDLITQFAAGAPQTLQHCDLRLDNVFFGAGEGSDSIALFDWQLAGRGPGAFDVAYFLSCSLDVNAPVETAEACVRSYHDELVAGGVEDYSFESCLRDYHRGLPIILHRLASTDTMELGDDRGQELITTWADRAAARLSGVDLDSLLDG